MIAFGTYDTQKHQRFKVLLEGLEAHGYNITEINFPLGISTAERVSFLQKPWKLPLFLYQILNRWAKLAKAARTYVSEFGQPETCLVGYMGHFDVLLARLLFPKSQIILDHLIFAGDTARDRRAAAPVTYALTLLDVFAMSIADIILTDTDEHLKMVPANKEAVTVLVGATDEWFSAGNQVLAENRPIISLEEHQPDKLKVIFFGLFTPLQGTPVLASALHQALADGQNIAITMVGTGQDLSECKKLLDTHQNITWIDWVDADALPKLVADHDICLGIFSDSPKGQRVIPNKVFQGLAAGCVVITSDSPPQRAELGDGLVLVEADSPADIAFLLKELGKNEHLAVARRRAHSVRDRIKADVVVRPLLPYLSESPGT